MARRCRIGAASTAWRTSRRERDRHPSCYLLLGEIHTKKFARAILRSSDIYTWRRVVRLSGRSILYYYVWNAEWIYDRLLSPAVYPTARLVRYTHSPSHFAVRTASDEESKRRPTKPRAEETVDQSSPKEKYLWGKRARILPRRELITRCRLSRFVVPGQRIRLGVSRAKRASAGRA